MEYEDVITYQDDQVNHAREFLAHLFLQGRIYGILEEYHMIHKWQKTNLNFRTMKILGHVLSKEGRGPDPNLVKSVALLARPTTTTTLLSFLGLCRVASDYIPNLAEVLAPLQMLTKKGRDIIGEWGPDQQKAFEDVKLLLANKPVLRDIDPNKQFRVEVDACRVGKGIGALLMQKSDEGVWQVVAY